MDARTLRAALLTVASVALLLLPAATATPNPASVTIAGSLQSEAGCPGDWDPGCAATHLTYDAGDDVWQGTFSLPAGALRVQGRAQRRVGRELRPARGVERREHPARPRRRRRRVKFYYDHKSHWATDNKGSVIAVAPGSFQSELGCSGRLGSRLPALVARGPRRRRHLHVRDDRAPGRLVRGARSRSTRPGTRTTAQGGVPGGANIPFTVPADNPRSRSRTSRRRTS